MRSMEASDERKVSPSAERLVARDHDDVGHQPYMLFPKSPSPAQGASVDGGVEMRPSGCDDQPDARRSDFVITQSG